MTDNKLSDSNPSLDTAASQPAPQSEQAEYLPTRIWPFILLFVLAGSASVLPTFMETVPDWAFVVSMLGPVVCGTLVILGWPIFSRTQRSEKVIGFFGLLTCVVVTFFLNDKSMKDVGMMYVAIPLGTGCFAVGAAVFSRWLSYKRTIIALLLAACGFGFSTLLRNEGMWGDAKLGLAWRWEDSLEEKAMQRRNQVTNKSQESFSVDEMDEWLRKPEWTEFRGTGRLGKQTDGPQFSTDWSTQPPEELWRIPVGPAWSSFSKAGNLLFTQEQHGENEAVVCYDAQTGKEVWKQQIESRFYEALGGPGPRSTPTIAQGDLFICGANGVLQRINATTGQAMWTQELQKVADREPPNWGFCGSPLVVGSMVIVHAGGKENLGTLAFDINTSVLRWSVPAGDHTYSSPQLCNIEGEELVMMLTNLELTLIEPMSGEIRLVHEWKSSSMYRALQPQLIDQNLILIPSGSGSGARLLKISKDADKLTSEEVWTSLHLKSDYNDMVIHDGYVYGFDGSIFTCVDLKTGKRKWKKGRYGKGQVLLLEAAKLLLVQGERGHIVLLKAEPEKHVELAKFQPLKSKTWNHPVVIGDRLYIRNSEEAACFQLPLATEKTASN